MIKIIDVDTLFEKYIKDYVYSNIGKINPDEIEDNIPLLYKKFGDEKIEELDGETPNSYYKKFSINELIDALISHEEKGVSVSDMLCEAILSKKDGDKAISKALLKDYPEQTTLYLMNFLNDLNAEIPTERFLEFLLLDYSMAIKELATEMLSKRADRVKERLLQEFSTLSGETKEFVLEILSNVKLKDDKVFDVLINEFVKNQDKIPYYCALISRYGDERAVPFLKTVIKDEKINYADFEELRFALEVLGETYDDERDFSKDKYYNKIKKNRTSKKD